MSSMEELWRSVKKTAVKAADTTARKAEELWDGGKLSLRIAKIEGEIDEKLLALGKLIYNAHTTGEDNCQEVEVLLEAVDGLQTELTALREQAAERKAKKICPSCQVACEKDARFCPACGKEL